jgi:hypothetical protein
MKNTIICIKGSRQTGKTPTIRDLYGKIASEEEKSNNENYLHPYKDIEDDIILYKGIKIGFYGCGDPGYLQYEHVSDLIKKECQIIICSCRNWGQTRNDIHKAATEYNYDLIYTSTYQSPSGLQDFLRENFVIALITLVDSCINR